MKANNIPNFSWSLVTGSNDLSGNQYRAVKVVSDVAAKVTGATDKVVGFQTDNPTGANQAVRIESNGIVVAQCGAAVTSGSEVTIMADGKIENINGANTVVGTALESGVLNDKISIKLKNM
jgi:hypothetical protein